LATIVIVWGSSVLEAFLHVTLPPLATLIVPGDQCCVSLTPTFLLNVALPTAFTVVPLGAPEATATATAAIAQAAISARLTRLRWCI
jgi:hypothetical protein